MDMMKFTERIHDDRVRKRQRLSTVWIEDQHIVRVGHVMSMSDHLNKMPTRVCERVGKD